MPQMWSSPSISTWPLLRSVLLAMQVEHGDLAQPVVQVGAGLVDGEVVLLVIGVDEPLQAALAERAVADDGGRHEVDAHRLAQPVGGELATVQAGLEVPQRPLAAQRLVDGLRRPASPSRRDVDEERGVAAPRHATLDVDLAAGEQLELRATVASSVHPRADVPVGVDRQVAPHARRAAGGHQAVGVLAERDAPGRG